MKTSLHGVDFIKQWESFRPTVYPDQGGRPTIGYGHLLHIGDPTTVTIEQATIMLEHDLATAESAVNSLVKVPLTQNEFDALVSFTFNLGSGALLASAMLHFLNNGDRTSAAQEFKKWDHVFIAGRLVESEGLKKRRLAEETLFLTPETAPVPPIEVTPVVPDPGQLAESDLTPPDDPKA